MRVWDSEIRDLLKLHESLRVTKPGLDKELNKLISTDDENMVLVYARRCLEVIISELCDKELGRPRGTEPLKGIIDKLNKENKVPHNIIVSMQHLNSLSAFGAHPKDFDPKQVRPVILDLTTIIEWYYSYSKNANPNIKGKPDIKEALTKGSTKTGKTGKKLKTVISISLLVSLFAAFLVIFIINRQKTDINKTGDKIESLVILPFKNYTGNEIPEHFVDGIHYSLISNLGQVKGLRIIGPTSSNKYKNTDLSVSEIAAELNVDAAIEGALMAAGDSINLKLILIKTGEEEKQLWTGDYKKELSQILTLYNQITKQVA